MKKYNLRSPVTVVYNRFSGSAERTESDFLADEDTVEAAKAVANALSANGRKVSLFEVTEDNIFQLGVDKKSIYFNLAEELGSLPKSDYLVAEQLEKMQVPFTGSGSATLKFTRDKVETKELLIAHSLPTPKFQIFETDHIGNFSLNFPVICKPSREDGSLGISSDSIVNNLKDLKVQVARLLEIYNDPVLVEEYIEGRELNVTVINNGDKVEVLPISEVLFGDWFEGKYKMVDFSSKWEEESQSYKNSWGVAPANLDRKTKELVDLVSLNAYKLTDCTDYSRIDIRLSPIGEPFILEVNANPGISPDTGAVRSAKAAGLTYEQFLEEIVMMAVRRYEQNFDFSTSFDSLAVS